MHSDHAILHLAPAPAPLPLDSDRLHAAFRHGRLIYDANGFRMGVFLGHEALTAVAHFLLIPLDGFEKTL